MNLGARAREVNLKGRAYFLRIVGGGCSELPARYLEFVGWCGGLWCVCVIGVLSILVVSLG